MFKIVDIAQIQPPFQHIDWDPVIYLDQYKKFINLSFFYVMARDEARSLISGQAPLSNIELKIMVTKKREKLKKHHLFLTILFFLLQGITIGLSLSTSLLAFLAKSHIPKYNSGLLLAVGIIGIVLTTVNTAKERSGLESKRETVAICLALYGRLLDKIALNYWGTITEQELTVKVINKLDKISAKCNGEF